MGHHVYNFNFYSKRATFLFITRINVRFDNFNEQCFKVH